MISSIFMICLTQQSNINTFPHITRLFIFLSDCVHKMKLFSRPSTLFFVFLIPVWGQESQCRTITEVTVRQFTRAEWKQSDLNSYMAENYYSRCCFSKSRRLANKAHALLILNFEERVELWIIALLSINYGNGVCIANFFEMLSRSLACQEVKGFPGASSRSTEISLRVQMSCRHESMTRWALTVIIRASMGALCRKKNIEEIFRWADVWSCFC